jgi:hypothetical protein
MKVSKECELGNFYVDENSDCESCGSIPFQVTWSNGYTFYCLDCARCHDNFVEPTDKIIAELKKIRDDNLMKLINSPIL